MSKKYPTYKPSGVEWIGEIPTHWKITKGRYSIKITNGFPFVSSKFTADTTKGFPLIRIRDIFSAETAMNYDGPIEESAVVRKDDLLISMDGDFEISRWPGKFGLLNQRVCKVEGNHGVHNGFLFYFLPTELKVINDITYFTTVKHLSSSNVENMTVVLPTYKEQQAIDDYLDHKTTLIDKTIHKKQRLIQLLQEERTALINQAVTRGLNPDVQLKPCGVEWLVDMPGHWEVKKLKYVVHNVMTGSTPPSNNETYYDGQVKWFTPSDFSDKFYLNDSKRKLSNVAVEEGVVTIYPPNSVLFVGIGATLGKSALCKETSTSNQQINAIVFDQQQILPLYGLLYLRAISQTLVSLSNSATLAILNQTQTKNLWITVPPLDEQQEIINTVLTVSSKVDETILHEQKSITLLQEYRTTLINEVVTGKRCVLPIKEEVYA